MREYIGRFEDKIKYDLLTGCWLWTGGLNGDGYGGFAMNGVYYKAHQVSYLTYTGQIPAGKCVMHVCDVRNCVNPDHLVLGTHQDNMRDMKEKGRGNGPRGEMAHKSKLTKEQVLKIRSDPRNPKEIADEYGVNFTNVYRIKAGQTWKWL